MSDLAPEIRDALTGIQKLMADAANLVEDAMKKLVERQTAETAQTRCDSCSKTGVSDKPYPEMEKVLDGVDHGRGRRESLNGLYPELQYEHGHDGRVKKDSETVRELNRERHSSLFDAYDRYRGIFTDKQWALIELRFHEGRTQAEIATLRGISRATVCETLRRARQNLEACWKQNRKENRDFSPE
jgi:predicted transcriptional regulator